MNYFFLGLVFIASVGGALFGYDTGIVSGAMIQIKSDGSKYPEVGGMNLGNFWQEAVVSITTIGAALGSVACGTLNRLYGRRLVNLLAALLFVGSCVLMALAQNVQVLLAGRFCVGIGVGFAATTVPMYIAEVAPSDKRGQLITVNNVAIVAGQVLASLVACYFDVRKTHDGWRYMLFLGAVPGAVMFIGFLFLPESPRWLVAAGKRDKAHECLRKIRNEEDDIDGELKEIEEAVGNESHLRAPTLSELWADKGIRNALKVGCGLQLLQQLVGINTIMYYSATILQNSSDATDKSPLDHENVVSTCLSSAVAFAQMAGCIIGMFLIDRYGRKTLVLWSLGGAIVALLALGGVFVAKTNQVLAAVVMCAYLLSFGMGMSAIPWVFNAEVYPLYARATCIAISTTVNWCSSFLISFTFLTVAEALSTDRQNPKDHPDGAFWLYAIFGMIGFVNLRKYMPETKGLSLEEITQQFKAGSNENAPLIHRDLETGRALQNP